MSKKTKKKKIVKSFRKIRRIKRPDGLRMKTVPGYTFRTFVDTVSSRYGSRICYRVFGEGDENDVTYSQIGWYARAVSSYLLSIGIEKGDRIAILGESSPQWMIMYLGITEIGAIAVPILPEFSSKELSEIIEKSSVKGIAVNIKNYRKVAPSLQKEILLFRLNDLCHIALTEGYEFNNAPGFSMRNFKINLNAIDEINLSESDTASIIFTSGTTGPGKAVVLSHLNLLRNADEATDVYVKLKKGMKVLSILPMSHVYEFTIGQILVMMCGLEITFLGRPPATSVLLPALSEVRPHVMLTVPLLIEKVFRVAVLPVIKTEKISKLIKNPFTSGFVYRTIGHKLKSTFGGRLKFFGVGGAALDNDIALFLHKAHFPYSIGYGLTETSPLIAGCGSAHRRHRPGFIGEVTSDDDVILLNKDENGVGEIAVKGVNVTSGYYNNDELNEESFTEDGYFKTGDLGYMDRKGRLAIRGRTKTMILGPGGENIYPESIESIINSMDFVEESLVVPENGALIALIKIDLNLMAEKMKLNAKGAVEESLKYIRRIRNDVNEQLASFSKISDVVLQEEDFERTPTQKIKRFLYPKKKAKKDGGTE